jgi:hypothetical protein
VQVDCTPFGSMFETLQAPLVPLPSVTVPAAKVFEWLDEVAEKSP